MAVTASSAKRLRLFVAIPVPETVRTGMARVQDELLGFASPADVRWVDPLQFHLTLKFLGDVAAESVDAVKASLRSAVAGISPFRLRAGGIGFFPDARSPRVIWIGCENDDGRLATLQRRIEDVLAPFAEKPGEEKFRAHVTIGRFQKFRRHKTEKLLPRAMALGGRVFGEWRVDAVELMQSELFPDGSRHTVLASVPL